MELEVFKAINSITSELAKTGIEKGRRNQQQGYAFRGIDDIYNTLASLLSVYGLCIMPEVLERIQVERNTIKGGVVFYTTVKVKYTLVSSKDGSRFEATTFGEAMDTADKSTNKAMSAAYKYLCLQVFCIPTEGDNDADATTPDAVVSLKNEIKSEKAKATRDLNKQVAEYNKTDDGLKSRYTTMIAMVKSMPQIDQYNKDKVLVNKALELLDDLSKAGKKTAYDTLNTLLNDKMLKEEPDEIPADICSKVEPEDYLMAG